MLEEIAGCDLLGKISNASELQLEQKCTDTEKEHLELVPPDIDTSGLETIHDILKNCDVQDVNDHQENIDTLLFVSVQMWPLNCSLISSSMSYRRASLYSVTPHPVSSRPTNCDSAILRK